MSPVIEQRQWLRKEAASDGSRKPPRFDDALGWVEEESQGRPYDAGIFQLALSMVAIHTTSDLMTEKC